MKRHDTWRRVTSGLAIAAVAIIGSGSVASAEDLLWETLPGGSRLHTSSTSMVLGGIYRTNDEVADDFNVDGSIDRLVFHGRSCISCPQPVTLGAFVRFYEWTASGPGALQAEYYLPEGDPGFIHGPWPGTVDIRLPESFEATGFHFAAVQLHFDDSGGLWTPYQANEGNPVHEPAYYRDNLRGGTWAPDADWLGVPYNADLWIELWGTSGGSRPFIDGLSATTLDRSGRIVVTGGLWGGEQGNSQLLFDGIPAVVTQWTSSSIVGYVSEASSLGTVPVQVVTDAGASNPVMLNVTARQRSGRTKWRFAVDSSYMTHRPGVGPDGSIYVVDLHGRLYALSEDGGLMWMVDALQGQDGLASEGPVVVGDDGTIYVGVNPLGPTVELVAVSPVGEIQWTFTVPNAIAWLAGPNLGPDGNVYGVMNNGGPYDVFSLTPSGSLRWNRQGQPFLFQYAPLGSEIEFGPSQPGGVVDQLLVASDRPGSGNIWAFDMQSGGQEFSFSIGWAPGFFQQYVPQLAADPATGAFYYAGGPSRGLYAYHPDGSFSWRHNPDIRSESSAPDVGPDGTVYFSWDMSHIGAVGPDGQPRWTYTDLNNIMREGPIVSPNNDQLTIGGQPSFGVNGWIRSFATGNGAEQWRVDLSHNGPGYLVPSGRGLFTPDGRTVYYPVDVAANEEYCYLYSIDAGGQYNISITGQCPGTVNLSWSGALPGRQQGILFASNTGTFTINTGVCSGTQLGLGTQNLRLYNTIGSGNGAGSVNAQASAGACRGYIQMIQVPGCETSNVVQVP